MRDSRIGETAPPPVGVNVLVYDIAPEGPAAVSFRGIWSFRFAMLAVVGSVLHGPDLTLPLPSTMFEVSRSIERQRNAKGGAHGKVHSRTAYAAP